MPENHTYRLSSLLVRGDQPLIGVMTEEKARPVVRYFTEEKLRMQSSPKIQPKRR